VGNQLSEILHAPRGETVMASQEFEYDIANRLIDVNGTPVTWDSNGNLLNDGTQSYTYDAANRLVGVSQGEDVYTYAYNGLGDRVSQVLNGQTTNYALDLNAGLTQVLQDGEQTYLYGVNRVAQVAETQVGYFLPDALGSVRQMVDETGAVTLQQSYSPYGEVVVSEGTGETDYAFTGEWQSASTNLVYLRARFYQPSTGRFLNRDKWEGEPKQPKTFNYWNYAESNPIKYTDPTGMYVYDRYKAVTYALSWDHQSGIDPEYDFTYNAPYMDWSNQCTIFASSALHYGGVRDPREDPVKAGNADNPQEPYWDLSVMKAGGWEYSGYAGQSPWFHTTAFYNFASRVIGSTVLTYHNPPQLTGDLLYGQNAPLDLTKENTWLNALRSVRSLITEGDLVFYGTSKSSWDHVAVVVGWGLPTTFGEKSYPGSGPSGSYPISSLYPTVDMLRKCNNHWMEYYPLLPLRPLVVERSGGINYTSWRSLDNTYKPVGLIEIVHVENR
jgi:RHS repeat-associated protein